MVEESADKSYELCLINIHESVSTCLWKTTLVCLDMSYGGNVNPNMVERTLDRSFKKTAGDFKCTTPPVILFHVALARFTDAH